MKKRGSMNNASLKSVIQVLEFVGRTKVPMPVAVKMAVAREELERHERHVDGVRKDLIARMAVLDDDGEPVPLNEKHPHWAEINSEFDELMAAPAPDVGRFTLYSRGDEFSWDKDFKTAIEGMEPNIVHGLLPIMDIVMDIVEAECDPEGGPE